MKDVQIFNSVVMELEKLEHQASYSVSLEVIISTRYWYDDREASFWRISSTETEQEA